MVHIQLNGIKDERFLRPLTQIANLFFEETKVSIQPVDQADLIIEIKIEENGATATLNQFSASFAYQSQFDTLFRQQKHAVSHVYLEVLQKYTGIHQKWGMLTGIRPTKLMHRSVRDNISAAVTKQQLQTQYLIMDEKLDLMDRIINRQLQVVPDLYELQNEVSIYIGIPFCPTKCAYCTFPAYAINAKNGSVSSFLGGLHYEMRQIGKWLTDHNIKITTIYYGGGTPTSISAEEMDLLYEEMYRCFPHMDQVREITVEAGRPDTISTDKLTVLNKWGIDRISINPQSYIQDTLKAIGRHHTVEETIDKYHLAKSMGLNNINMDLIIGLPGEGVDEFKYTLDETEKLMPESLTVHTLSFKRASEMTKNKQRYEVASREEAEQMMQLAQDWTTEHGYEPYYLYRQKNILGNLENVGYAIPGQESIYNIMIMEEQQTILGIGCGAASKFIDPASGKIEHFANPKDPRSYNESHVHYTEEKIKKLEQLFTQTTHLKKCIKSENSTGVSNGQGLGDD